MPNKDYITARDKTFLLSFTLTRLQRVFNPISNLISLLILGAVLVTPLLIIGSLPIALMYPKLWVPLTWIMLAEALILILMLLVLRVGMIQPLTSLIKNKDYINTIEIGDNVIFYGINSLEHRNYYQLPLKACRISRGLLGVNIVSEKKVISEIALVIPCNAMPFDELKKITERD